MQLRNTCDAAPKRLLIVRAALLLSDIAQVFSNYCCPPTYLLGLEVVLDGASRRSRAWRGEIAETRSGAVI